MKTKLQAILITVLLFSLPVINYGQTPDLKTCADFILFTSSGSVTNTGVSQILGGAIGTNAGALTGFDDVNCVKHIANAATIQCDLDLRAVYDEISAIVPTATLIAANVSGSTITPGIYQINSALDLIGHLTLNAQGDPTALFIFKVTGAITTAASVNILLTNGASVNNVFWHGTGAIGAGASASIKGTFMTNAGAITLGAGASLEGRALTVIGEVSINSSTLTGCINPVATIVTLTQPSCSAETGTIEVTAPLGAGFSYSIDGVDFTNTTGLFTLVPAGDYTVTSKNADGCISMTNITLTGFPHPPTLGTVTDFVLFTSVGDVGNTGVSIITGGAIGTNAGVLTGFETTDCVKHIQNAETAQCMSDLQAASDEIAAIPTTATIAAVNLSGATFTSGVYQILSAADLALDLTLDAENNPDALFIFKITGAFSVAATVDILLINGANVNNVFWRVDGAISAGTGATLRGTFLASAGAITLGAGTVLEGRALTITGAVNINNSVISVCIKPNDPIITLTQPNCTQATGTITITSPTALGMTYRIDYCPFTNTTGIFNNVSAGTYLVTAMNSDGCISDGTTVVINEDSPPITWIGTAGNEWNNAGNWDLLEIPDAYCDVVIPINEVVIIGTETPAACKSLSIGAGAVLTIESGKTLTVYGTLTNNATITGLIMKSDAGGTASLIHNTANVPATFERYMNDADWTNWRDGWHFVSSPVALQAISPNFTVDPASDYDFYSWYEPSNLWVNFKNNINPPTWSTANTINNGLVNSSSNLLAGKGYMVAYNAADVKVFSGNLNVANLTVQDLTITGTSNASRSWHLLGNPFSSALTWDAGSAWNFTNIAGVAKIWNEALQAYSDLTSTPASSIPATNGFMVQASTGTGSLTLPAAKRVHSAQAFYKNTVSIPRIVLLASPIDRSSGQQSTVCFIPEATEDFDLMFDSEFLAGYAPRFYSISDDFKLSTNSLPSMNDEIVIPFGFVKNSASAYSIELSETIQGQTLYLSDLKTNAVHILNDNPVYNFNSEEGDDPNRFLLYFGTVGIGNQTDAENFRTYFSGGNLYMMIHDGKAVLEVFDILGRIVQSKTIFGEGLHSQPFNQPSGLYIVRLLGKNGAKTVKIIVD